MTDPATSIEPARPAGGLDTAYLLRVLNLLIGFGRIIGHQLGQKAEAGLAPIADCIRAQSRLDSTIRRMIMLWRAMCLPGFGERVGPAAGKQRGRPQAGDAAARRKAARRDRYDEPDAPYDITGKTLDEIIREICGDLGVAPLGARAWKRLTREQIETLVADAVVLLLEAAAAEAAAPTVPRRLHWGTRSWLAARARAARRLERRVRDG